MMGQNPDVSPYTITAVDEPATGPYAPFNQASGGGASVITPVHSEVMPELTFADEMRNLHEMGFTDMHMNFEALHAAHEAHAPQDRLVQQAISILTESAPPEDPYLVQAAESPFQDDLVMLRDMGFEDLDANVNALQKVEGHPNMVQAAMSYLVN